MLTDRPSVWRVLSDTSRIITAHSRNFSALSLLFIFPNSVAAVIYSFLFLPASIHSHHRRSLSGVSTPASAVLPIGKSQLLIQLLYFLSLFLFSPCAVSSITYSTCHGFYGRPVSFISSLKSILSSFFPLLATTLAVEMIMGLITLGFIILMLLSYHGLSLLGFEIDYDTQYSLVLISIIVIATLLVGVLIYLQVEWYLANAIVVLESKWGFAPLKRSSYLVKGVRGVVFLIILLFGILSGLLSIWFLRVVANAGRNEEGWFSGWLVLEIAVFALFSTVLSLYGLAANAVLFVYCKAWHGESAFEIGDEFSSKYVRLPSGVVNVV